MLIGLARTLRVTFASMANPLRIHLQPIQTDLPSTPNHLASLLKTTESRIRTQMIDPNSNRIEREEAELLSLINGFKLDAGRQECELKQRPPVVTIMGHVDHGKTTLLDFLRNSDIAKHEHGGITQKIGAFNINYNGQKVTVIDTPGHQAFVNMRVRGATVTDMIVLVISATEGVKQQTLEVIDLARNSNIPMIIAINKIDIPEADPENVERQLAEKNVPIEPIGGNIQVVHISAKQGTNVDLLIELVLEQWKDLGMKAQINGNIEATVLEAHPTDSDMNSATLLMQKGQLNVGDYIVAGSSYCRVKLIRDDRGNVLEKAGPGEAVEVVGFKELPSSGEVVFSVDNQNKAKFVVDRRQKKQNESVKRQILNASSTKIKITSGKEKRALYRGLGNAWLEKFKTLEESIKADIRELEDLVEKGKATPSDKLTLETKKHDLSVHKQYVHQYLEDVIKKEDTFNLIIRSSDRGCEETVLKELQKLKEQAMKMYNINVNLISSDVGEVVESDVRDAHLFGATIFTFGTASKPEAVKAMKACNIAPRNHKLLHTLLEDIKNAIIKKSKREDPNLKERGQATIAEVFKVNINKNEQKLAAGLKISEGRLCKKYKYRLYRNDQPISKTIRLESIKHFKKEVIELKKGDECTVLFESDVEFKKGDVLRAYE